jgi:hypothetical protein
MIAWRRCWLALAVVSCSSLPAVGQEAVVAGAEEASGEPAAAAEEVAGNPLVPKIRFGFEARAHWRDSDAAAFRNPFPFGPDALPPGATASFLTPPDPGRHFELSTAILLLDASWGEDVVGRLKIDFIDLHDRNPTSGDKQVDVDEAWIRFGFDPEPGNLPAVGGGYLKVGKFGKFERQDDRHLESYGLVSTAFNRFEDLGVEAGYNFGRHVYLKASYTAGNPVFLRDPNALAGDNGTEELLRSQPNNEPPYGSGLVIAYDAEVEDASFDGAEETGIGLGFRFADASGRRAVDGLVWAYQRDLAERVELEGTFYGGDLDVLDGPAPGFGLPLSDDEKQEVGANLWVYFDDLSVFAQFVDQQLAGMDRVGWEAEVAWRFELPLVWAVGGQQLFQWIQPAVRYSYLDPDFEGGSPAYPAPSVRWEWTKIDYGVRVGLLSGVDLTLELADNTFVVRGVDRSADEALATLRFSL